MKKHDHICKHAVRSKKNITSGFLGGSDSSFALKIGEGDKKVLVRKCLFLFVCVLWPKPIPEDRQDCEIRCYPVPGAVSIPQSSWLPLICFSTVSIFLSSPSSLSFGVLVDHVLCIRASVEVLSHLIVAYESGMVPESQQTPH